MNMVHSNRILKISFLSLLFLAIITGSGYTQNNPVGTKSSAGSIGSISSGENSFNYSDSLSEFEKRQIVSSLNPNQIAELFDSLSDNEKQEFFLLLSNTEKRNLFLNLSTKEKKFIINTLNDSDKIDTFNIIDDESKILVLEGLNNIEKSRLIKSLPDTELKRLAEQYPEIMTGIDLSELKTLDIDPEDEPLPDTEPKSRLENIFSSQPLTGFDKDLEQYGYDYFLGESSFAPVQNVPVGSDYILGPGDSFTIHLWGKVEDSHYGTVTSEGTINLPRLGTLNITGLTLSELKTFLTNKYKEYHKEFQMSITMDSLRTVDVYMIGEMKKPGTYNLSSLSTVVSALFASGGPGKNGSLRNIKVLNNGKLLKTIDLYDFFISGSNADDIRLQQGYTVFVPVIGPVAGISGLVKRPSIYEMKGNQTLEDVIDLAGGILPTGHLQNIVIERVSGHKRRVVKSFDLDPASKISNRNLKTVIEDGDLIKIFPIYNKKEKVVFLEGNVKYPREYELKDGMRVKDIIPSYDYLLPESYLQQAEIVTLVPPNLQPELRIFNLGALLDGDESQNLSLKNQDRIVIYNLWEKMDLPEVSISGALRNPGVYRLYEGMTIKDLIFKAGNPTPGAYLVKGELTRMVPGSNGVELIKISFSPQNVITGNTQENLKLQPNDQVHIREIPRYFASLEKKVLLEGEFKFPGEYSFTEGERISSVIERAGGFTNEAYLYGSVFFRESVKSIWAERKKEYIDRLEQEIFTVSAFAADTALDPEKAAMALQALNAKKEMLEKLRLSEPTGRMVLDISEIMLMPSGDNDIELRPGDRIVIGKKPDSVFIMGEVFNPNAMVYTKDKDVDYYLNLVGGMTSNADKRQIYIVKADGTVVSKKQGKLGLFNWDNEKHRWGFGSFNSIKLLPGDTVIVPKKVVESSWLKVFKDTTSIMYEIAVSAGVLHEMFKD